MANITGPQLGAMLPDLLWLTRYAQAPSSTYCLWEVLLYIHHTAEETESQPLEFTVTDPELNLPLTNYKL